jgi:hypothetical protein
MSADKSYIKAHDDAVAKAEGSRQAAAVAGASQATVVSADVTFYRAVAKSAIANSVSPSAAMQVLRDLGVTGLSIAFLVAASWLIGPTKVHAAPLVAPCTELTVTSVECDPVNSANPLPVSPNAFPAGATPVTASASGTTAAVTATIPAIAAKTAFLCGFVDDAVATGGTAVTGAITGLIGGTFTYIQQVGTLTGTGNYHYNLNFTPCVPASAVNTQIQLISGAAGSGGVQGVMMWGYYK